MDGDCIIKLNSRQKVSKLGFVYIIIFSTVLLPNIRMLNFPEFRIEQLLIMFLLIYSVVVRLIDDNLTIRVSKFIFALIVFSFLF